MAENETTPVEVPQRDREFDVAAAEARMKASRTRMVIGGVVAVGGTFATLVSYSNAEPGDRYTLWWGAIIFGVLGFLAGLADYVSASKARTKALAPTPELGPALEAAAVIDAPPSTAPLPPPPPPPPPVAPVVTPWVPSPAPTPRPAPMAAPNGAQPWVPSSAPTRRGGRLPWVVLGVLAATIVAVAVALSVGGDDSGDRTSRADREGVDIDRDEGETAAPTSAAPTTTPEVITPASPGTGAPVSTDVVETAIGPLQITDVRRTVTYPEPCGTEPNCLESTSGERVVVLQLLASGPVSESMKETIQDEMFGSTIDDGTGAWVQARWITYGADSFEVAYAFLGADQPATLTLVWAGNPPIALAG